MMLQQQDKQAKIQEFADLLGQRNNAVQKQNLGLELSEYENMLINSPHQDWLLISAMLNGAEIEEDIYADFLQYPNHYKIEEGVIIFDDAWEEKAAEKEAKRIAGLHITKQDFYVYLCQPAGISYELLVQKIQELGMIANWELCNHVYYGVIKPFLSALPLGKTDAEIIAVFEEHCKE